jgi:hypothetical protein
VSLYPVVPGAGDAFAEDGLMVAVRLADVASPLRDGRPLAPGGASAPVIGGTARIRSGEVTVFCKVVAVAPTVVRRDGRVQAAGGPAGGAPDGPPDGSQGQHLADGADAAHDRERARAFEFSRHARLRGS